MAGTRNPILIQTSTPEPTTGDYLVEFIDFKGNVKSQYVDLLEDATPPAHPVYEHLTADGYNIGYDKITRDKQIGFMYKTTDGKTYIFCTFTNTTGLDATLNLYKWDTGFMTINWGDGETSTTSASGNATIIKPNPYATAGNYTITIESATGWNNKYVTELITPIKALTGIYVGSNFTYMNFSCISNAKALNFMSLTQNFTNLRGGLGGTGLVCLIPPENIIFNDGNDHFTNTWALRYLIFPDTYTLPSTASTYMRMFNCNYSIMSLYLNQEVIRDSQHSYNNALKKCTLSDIVTIIQGNCFYSCYLCTEYIILAVTPPSLASTASLAVVSNTRVYVPDASVTGYQAATTWVAIPDNIYPISELSAYNGAIFFNTNGGTVVLHLRGFDGLAGIEPTAPTKSGFTFNGWYKDAGLTTAWNWETDVFPATNLTLYAKWI